MAEDLDAYHAAYGESFAFADENLAMLSWYAARLVDGLRMPAAKSLLSLGIGYQTVSRALLAALGDQLERYVIVEGSQRILDDLRRALDQPACLQLVHGRFEDYRSPEPFDAIEMGFVLEHVADPGAILRRYREQLAPAGRMFIAVPNARSLHRLIGQSAGMIDDLYALSEADLELGHRRYFDLDSLEELVSSAGLAVERREGIFLKLLSTAQLRQLALAADVQQALYTLGRDHPAICNAILLEARLADG
jgi:SAM-dependent methyltransferase